MTKPTRLARRISDLSSPEVRVRRKAVRKLTDYADQYATSSLIQALEDSDIYVRKNAIVALGVLRAREAIEALLRLSADRRAGVRREAVRALALVAQTNHDLISSVVPAILLAARRDNDNRRESYGEALCTIGKPVIAALTREYESQSNRFFHKWIEFALVSMQNRENIDVIRHILADPTLNPSQQWPVIEVLTSRRVRRLFMPKRLLDPRLLCESIATDVHKSESDATRTGAQNIMNYLSLGRASQRSYERPQDQHELLRTPTPQKTDNASNSLLRASNHLVDATEIDQMVQKTQQTQQHKKPGNLSRALRPLIRPLEKIWTRWQNRAEI